jgi:hypothetical protein
MKPLIHGAFISINSSFIQGLALGGEYGEPQPMCRACPGTKRILDFDSDYCNGGFIHLFNGNFTRNILTPEQFDEWGWRVPFWLSIVMVEFRI